MLGVRRLNCNVVPLRIISAIEFHPQVKMKYISLKVLISFFFHIQIALCPQTLTIITCLSKCRKGDVFKHSSIFLHLFRTYEEGGGQMTCYWYVLILLKFLSIV